ncbi:LPXTG cell wall anchor domain-containing protein [Actinoplanes sp. NPDC049118]|uniref:LPXTG cell wall anchor domain-containing protein n=1 Tax=Actinoplanes sp. NPDC049118 TaxID=3155769 RepID=UPI0033F7E1A4
MSMWLRRGTAATYAATLGVLLLAAPAAAAPAAPAPSGSAAPRKAAAPPASVDARLFLYNEGGPGSVAPGASVTFVMSTAGIPENVPQHKTVVLELPEGVTFRVANNQHASGPCVPDAAGRRVTCTTQDPVDQLPATNGAWWVTTDFADDLPLGEYVTAKATLSTEIPDPEQDNNVSTWDVFVATTGDMSVAISAPPGPWKVGDKFDATYKVHNFGPHRAPFSLTSGINPTSLRYTGWPEGCGFDPGEMQCTFGVLEAGKTFEFTMRFEVREYDADGISLTPTVYPGNQDTNAANNKASYRADIIKPSASPSPSPTGGQAGGEPTLPITGAPAVPLAAAGLSLLAAGAGALLLARRRRTS